MVIVALALLAQLAGLPAYTTADAVGQGQIGLAMPTGRYLVDLGPGCDAITPDINVEYLAGSGDVGALRAADNSTLCNVYFVGQLSDTPCALDDAGACDVAFDQSGD